MPRRAPRPGAYSAVVFDLDGTLLREANSWGALRRRLSPEHRSRAGARWRRYGEGLLSTHDFITEQAADLQGTSATLLDEVVAEIEYHEGVADACAALHAAGLRLAIVSAGISAFADRVGRDLGITVRHSNTLHVDAGGTFTGTADVGVPPGEKTPAFLAALEALGVSAEETVAVGDGSSDVDMFRLAALGVAFCPADHWTARAADAVIDTPDMRRLLPLVLP